jgi:hypothetical protein
MSEIEDEFSSDPELDEIDEINADLNVGLEENIETSDNKKVS